MSEMHIFSQHKFQLSRVNPLSNHSGGGSHPPRVFRRVGNRDDGNPRRKVQGALPLAAMLASTFLCVEGAQASNKKHGKSGDKRRGKSEETIESVTDVLWNMFGRILTNLGFSGVLGLMAGMALKKVGQLLAVTIGLVFVGIQALAYAGYITVNWQIVSKQVQSLLDVDKNGVLNEGDFKVWVSKGLVIISQGVPSVGGFLAGFLYAIRYL